MIKRYAEAEKGVTDALGVLAEQCAKFDGHNTEIDLDASMNAVKDMPYIFTYEDEGLKALLSVFAPGRDEVEVSALVHPDFRRQGLFKALLKDAAASCSSFGYEKGLFVCRCDSKTGQEVMKRWDKNIDHSELQMSCISPAGRCDIPDLEVAEARAEDIDELADLGAAAFGMDREAEKGMLKNSLDADNRIQFAAKRQGRFVALCAASVTEGKLMIFGLGVHPDERRKGYARATLRAMAKEAAKRAISELCLDVDADNPNAIALYRSFGFEETGCTDYFGFMLSDFR